MALERGGVSWDYYLRAGLSGIEMLLAAALLVYQPISTRNAPDDPDAAREYVIRKRRNRRYAGIYVLSLSTFQLATVLAHP